MSLGIVALEDVDHENVHYPYFARFRCDLLRYAPEDFREMYHELDSPQEAHGGTNYLRLAEFLMHPAYGIFENDSETRDMLVWMRSIIPSDAEDIDLEFLDRLIELFGRGQRVVMS